MPVPAKLSRTLQQTLGSEAADDLVTWMIDVDSHRRDLRDLNEQSLGRLDSRFGEHRASMEAMMAEHRRVVDAGLAAVREELHLQTAALRAELHEQTSALRAEMHEQTGALGKAFHSEISALRAEMHAGFAAIHETVKVLTRDIDRVDKRIDQRFGEVIKWSFLFWLGSVGAMIWLNRFLP